MAVEPRIKQLAKLTRPRLYEALPRERLFAVLDESSQRSAVWIAAPPGAGKTTLVAGWMENRDRAGIWYQVDAGDADPASFFYYLGIAERSRSGRPRKLRPLPLFSPEHLPDVPGFSRRFFRDLFARLEAPALLVLDNFQEAGEAAIQQIVRIAMENVPPGLSMVVLSRAPPAPEFVHLSANRALTLIDWEPLKLTRDETRQIMRQHEATDDRLVGELHERSGGWAAGLVLLAERVRRGAGLEELAAPESMQEIFGYFAGQLFDRSDAQTRRMLMLLSFPPNIPESAAAALAGNDAAAQLLERLYRRHLFTDRRRRTEPIYQFHALFRAFLRHRASAELNIHEQRDAARVAAHHLEQTGEIEAAMPLYIEALDWSATRQLILRKAADLISQGRWRVVVEWVGQLPEQQVAEDSWLLHWLGTAWIGVDPPRAREILDRACRQAVRSDDVLCQVQSAAGMVEAYFLEYAAFIPLDQWIPYLEKMFDGPALHMELDAELRAQSALLIALVFRMPDHSRIEQCVRWVEELVRTGADVNLRVTAATYLTLYGSFTGHLSVSGRAAAVLVPLLSDSAVTVFRRIFAWAVLNWYACNVSDVALGELATASNLAIASDEGQHLAERFACILGFYFDMDQRRIESARARLLRFEEIMDASQPYEEASLVNMKSWFGVYTGDPSLPLQHGKGAYELYLKAGSIPHIFMGLTGLIWGTIESGDHAAGRHWIGEHRRWSYRTNTEWSRSGPDSAEAIMALREGDWPMLDDRLNSIFACERNRTDQYGHMLSWCRSWASTLAAAALERGIHVPRALAFVREFNLEPPRGDLEIWPWPVKVRCLGTFSVEVNGEALAFGAKTPRKLLALLKAIVAHGGQEVPERKLADALWPDEEGDAAHQSFTTAMHRLRKLLGKKNLIRQREGRISLDANNVWVDALSFDSQSAHLKMMSQVEALRTIRLYRGAFLPDDDDAPWAFPVREKLRGRFLDIVSSTARQFESAGDTEAALELYRRGIEADELAETFHQGLMRCHHQVGRTPEALEAYRRMREVLTRHRGIEPSPATEELYRKLATRHGPARS